MKMQLSCALLITDVIGKIFFATFRTFSVYLTSSAPPAGVLTCRPRSFTSSPMRAFCRTADGKKRCRFVLVGVKVCSRVPAWACLSVWPPACLRRGKRMPKIKILINQAQHNCRYECKCAPVVCSSATATFRLRKTCVCVCV